MTYMPLSTMLSKFSDNSKNIVIACDIDSIFLCGTDSDRLHFYKLISKHPNINLVFLTGRSPELVMPLLDDPTLPMPQYLICDVGATIIDCYNQQVVPLQRKIDLLWPGEHIISDALIPFLGLLRQEVPQRNRCAYYCKPEVMSEKLKNKILSLNCSYQYSDKKYLDVLPKGISLISSLTMLAEYLNISLDTVLIAPNILFEENLKELEKGLSVALTKNSQKKISNKLKKNPRIFLAERSGCGAVIEAMAHFGLLGEKAQKALTKRTTLTGESKLVTVYHRLPYEETIKDGKTIRRRPTSPNGIIPTLLSFFKGGMEGSWVAWAESNKSSSDFEVHTTVDASQFPNLTAARVPLTKQQIDIFYKKFSKEAFWPVLHTFWERAHFNEKHWEIFVEINKKFAKASALEAAVGATVWIHDYNLWMVPAFLRELRPDIKIAFFHHTHFPSSDIFNVLPWRRQIVGSLLQCDYIGFHIPRQVENFVDVVRGMAPVEILETASCAPRFMTYGCAVGVDTMSTVIRVNERTVGLGAHPVGLDVNRISNAILSKTYQETKEKIQDEYKELKIILSVDRLDYTKGILEKLLAYEKLLENNKELHEKIKLVTICVPAAREMQIYDKLRNQIEQVSGRINGRFSRVGWFPLSFFFRSFTFDEVAAFYESASVMWITPLCDGLNLVALEYAATQGITDGHGVLVLSEFAGAAAVLKDALLTNPNDPKDLEKRLLQALTMSSQEAKSRMENNNQTIQHYNLKKWGIDFLDSVIHVENYSDFNNEISFKGAA